MPTDDYYRQQYIARINRAMDYIETNLDQELKLDQIAEVANFSKFHFHRIFKAMTGETLFGHIRRIRMEKAGNLLMDSQYRSITEIGIDLGYSSTAVFSRTFREYYGMSATAFREGGHVAYSKNRKLHRNISQSKRKDHQIDSGDQGHLASVSLTHQNQLTMNVEIKDLPEVNVAYVRHTGPFAEVGPAFDKLMQWAGPRGLFQQKDLRIMSVYHDDPEITEVDKLRTSVCITIDDTVEVGGEIGKMTVAGGQYACCRFEIDDKGFSEAWDQVMKWLPSSGYVCADRLPFEWYHNNAQEHPEKKHVVDICIPVKPM